jgi:ATP-dependent exoDNAse (exonuclease V) beta subunit
VLERPDGGVARADTVSPGGHRIESAGQPVDIVWWDPATLRLHADPPFGLRRQELIAKDVDPEVIAEGQRSYIEWRDAREAAVTRASEPSLHVRTASQWARGTERDAEPPDVEIVTLPAPARRPRGARYGTLVHASLATTSLEADRDAIARVVGTQGRIVRATPEEIASAQDVVLDVLKHPLLEQARSAGRQGRLFRETPITITIDGILVEGVVDVAFGDGGAITVVDFKTDRAEADIQAAYARRLALYARAIEQATGTPTRAVLMNV